MIYDNLEKVIPDTLQVVGDIDKYQKYFPIEGEVIVDIGAHIGLFTEKAAEVANIVIAVEPDPLLMDKLKKRMEGKHVATVLAGIGPENKATTIKSDGQANTLGSDGVETKMITFEALLAGFEIEKIDFLKIDCEGGEYDILTKDYMHWICDNVDRIAGEFHIHNDKHRKSILKVLSLFEGFDIDYRLETVDGMLINRRHLEDHLNYYTEILFFASPKTPIKDKASIRHHFCKKAYVEVNNGSGDYTVEFYNGGKLLHSSVVTGQGGYTECWFQYFIPYHIVVTNSMGTVIWDYTLDLKDKNVVIEMGSKSLGDTLAWVPYMDEFQKKHNCNLTAVSFNNKLFKDNYPNITFKEPGSVIKNVYAWYEIGWFYDGDVPNRFKHPTEFKNQPMQKTASDILGLDYQEINPKMVFSPLERPIVQQYVTIANHSTAQCKYWNHPTGWQEVVDYLKSEGYDVVLLSKEKDGYMGNKNPEGVLYPQDYDIQTIMNYIHHSEFFIGIGSGLSWLSWALGKHTVLISGFSEAYTEFQNNVTRISAPPGTNGGYFNKFRLDAGNWNWYPYPVNKEEDKFKESKLITSEMVIEAIQPLLEQVNVKT